MAVRTRDRMLRMAEFLLGDHAESQSQDEWVKYPAKLNEIKLGAHENALIPKKSSRPGFRSFANFIRSEPKDAVPRLILKMLGIPDDDCNYPHQAQMPSCQESSDVSQDDLEPSTEMLRQPETRPKSYDQLVAEMKDLSRREPLEDKPWHSLFALNKLRSWARRLGWLALQDGVDKISQLLSVSSQRLDPKQKDQPRSKLQRLKRGIPGYVNGKRIAAFPDTGSAQNVVSAAFVKERGLHVRESAEAFKLGNSKITKSTGIVDLVWAFAEDPAKAAKIVCHVLPDCHYDIILGHRFLKASETLTRFRRRITACMFTMVNVLHFNLLGGSQEYIRGSLWEIDGPLDIRALAALDTGAEGNIMSLDYALRQGFHVYNQPRNRKTIRYADGSYDETVGMVETRWIFESGLEIAVAFEVVEDCVQDVVFGEEIAYDVYATQAESIAQSFVEDASWRLATFSFVNKWQNVLRNMNLFRKGTRENEGPDPRTLGTMKHEESQERRRRDR